MILIILRPTIIPTFPTQKAYPASFFGRRVKLYIKTFFTVCLFYLKPSNFDSLEALPLIPLIVVSQKNECSLIEHNAYFFNVIPFTILLFQKRKDKGNV